MAGILIVDDEALNRELLSAFLEASGHVLMQAESGERALAMARDLKPDLVLLDVMMPGLDGFETTLRLKEMAGPEYLPVVLLTALNDQTSRTKGLRMGADEFLTKPVDRQELLVRVNNLLALRAKESALVKKNVELMELFRFKDEMSSLLVHDLKSPLGVILANYDYVAEGLKGADGAYLEALEDSQNAGRRMMRLLANLLDVAQLEANRLAIRRTTTRPAEMLHEIVGQRRIAASCRNISIETALDEGLEVEADADLVTRVMENLYDNALRYTPAGGRIEIGCSVHGAEAKIQIGNTGPPVPRDVRGLVFEKFGQASGRAGRMNLGLGLYFCRLAIEAHAGRIWIDETPALPTVFAVEIPTHAPLAA